MRQLSDLIFCSGSTCKRQTRVWLACLAGLISPTPSIYAQSSPPITYPVVQVEARRTDGSLAATFSWGYDLYRTTFSIEQVDPGNPPNSEQVCPAIGQAWDQASCDIVLFHAAPLGSCPSVTQAVIDAAPGDMLEPTSGGGAGFNDLCASWDYCMSTYGAPESCDRNAVQDGFRGCLVYARSIRDEAQHSGDGLGAAQLMYEAAMDECSVFLNEGPYDIMDSLMGSQGRQRVADRRGEQACRALAGLSNDYNCGLGIP